MSDTERSVRPPSLPPLSTTLLRSRRLGQRLVPLVSVWDWQLLAACRGGDPDLFFHPAGERDQARADRDRAAKLICAGCPVLVECAAHALATDERYGIWGGMTEDDREQLRAGRESSA